jgi:hypothetical protein
MKNWPVASERLPLLRMKEYLTCVWKDLRWRHSTTKRRLFNVIRRLFTAKWRLFKVLHLWPKVLSPYTNSPYTYGCSNFHPWPTPHFQYYRTRAPVLPNGFGSIGKCCRYDSVAIFEFGERTARTAKQPQDPARREKTVYFVFIKKWLLTLPQHKTIATQNQIKKTLNSRFNRRRWISITSRDNTPIPGHQLSVTSAVPHLPSGP